MQPCHAIGVLRVQCEFIKGTDAKGCLVLLLGKDSNHTMKIMRTTSDATQTELVRVKYSLSFYHDVIAFDIESNNSIGQLPVPGYLENNAESCLPLTTETNGSGKYQFSLHNDYSLGQYQMPYIGSETLISRQNHFVVIFVFIELIICL